MEWRRYDRNGESVDRISEWVQEVCSSCGVNSRETQRIRLTVEDTLIRIFEHCATAPQVEVGIGSRLGRRLFCLRYEGAPYDPNDRDGDDWSDRILEYLGISHSWSYRGRTNRLPIVIAERKSPRNDLWHSYGGHRGRRARPTGKAAAGEHP